MGGARRRPARRSSARAAAHGPTLLECQTYRHYGHSKSDPATYRPKEEVERWLERDPLKLTRARLLEMGAEERSRPSSARPREAMERAVEAALAAPYPEPGGATEFAGRELEFRDAIRDAIAEEIERDPAVVFFGEDVAAGRRRVRGDARACTSASAPSASSTPRSPSWRSPAPPSARP